MIAEDTTMQALRKEVSELTLRLKELGEENRDLRDICDESGIHVRCDQPAGVQGCSMTGDDMTMQALRKEVSEFTLRLKELGEENRDLREICNENGIRYAERLAARRHKRYFADLCEEHPLGRTTTASDVLGAANIVRGIAECAGSVLRLSLIHI